MIPSNTHEQIGFRRLLSKQDERYYHPAIRHSIFRELKKTHQDAVDSYKNDL